MKEQFKDKMQQLLFHQRGLCNFFNRIDRWYLISQLFHSTAMKIRLHTIAILWRKIGVIHDAITYPKSAATPLTDWLQTVGHQSFPMRYYTSLYLKGLQNCGPSKLAIKKKVDILGSRLRFSRFCIVIARSGFDTRRGRTLRACSFAPPWATKTYSTSLESSDVPPWVASRSRAWQDF